MNLVILAAVIAVACSAKLDRAYLPPASAKTAGGSSESLLTPFAVNSLTERQGGFPKGSFTNDFQGVVVDAALPGTRASSDGETGLGAPRIAYGSTNSKVGDAAFRGSLAGFRQTPGNSQYTGTNQAADVQTAGTIGTPQGFSQKPGDFQSFGQDSQGLQDRFSQGQSNSQGFSQGPRGSQGQVSRGPQNVQGSLGSQATGTNYQRSQALSARDREASVLRFDSNVGTDSYSYSFETDNGISAEENGVASNGVQAQGGYSYTGDDGQVYSVTYTADEGGYQPKGDHLPTPPPIPVEILKSLEQNAREEAAGQVDDGSYDAQKYNAEGDYSENVGANNEHNSRPPTKFGNRPESDATASGTFINQSNQPFVRPSPNALPGQREEINTGSNVQGSNAIQSTQNTNGFEKIQNNVASTNIQGNNVFGSPSDSNNFARGNKTPQNVFHSNNAHKEDHQQLGPESFNNQNVEVDDIRTQGHGVLPNSQVFGRPNGFNQQGTSNGKPSNNNSFSSVVTNENNFGQKEQYTHHGLGSKNEYLPPVNNFEQNRRPTTTTDHKSGSSTSITSSQDSNKFSQSFSNLLPVSEQEAEEKPQDSTSVDFNTGSQLNSQFGNYQNNKFSNNFQPNRFSSTQNGAQSKPEFSGSGSQNTGFASFQSQKATSQPLTELTTPFETSPNSQQNNAQTNIVFGTQSSQTHPTQPSFENIPQSNGISRFPKPTSGFPSTFTSSSSTTSAQGPISTPFNTHNRPSSHFPGQRPQNQGFEQGNEHKGIQTQAPQRFSQKEAVDVQFASSTQRPIFNQNTQQAQGPDNSYYYRQPSKTFNTPNSQLQNSRFPSSSSNQFNRVPQQSSFAHSQTSAQVSGSQQNFPVNSFESHDIPSRGSNRQPIQPVFSSPVPTSATQGSTIAEFNGITQATASSFTSGAPTSATQFGSQTSFSGFGQRPTQQSNNQFNNHISSQSSSLAGQQSFSQQTTAVPQSFSDINRNKGQHNSFQNQETDFEQQSNLNQADSTKGDSSNIPSQQHGGEIYEYNKPEQTLPPPDQKDTSTGSGQFGNKQSSDRFGQSQDSQSSTTSQIESQSGLQKRPQFGSQPPRSQFGQRNQLNGQSTISTLKPQSGNVQPTQSSFAQSFGAQKQPDQFHTQGSSIGENNRPQFGQRPLGNNQLSSPSNQFNQGSTNQQRPQFEQNRQKPCCQSLPNAPQSTQVSTHNLSGSNHEQFGLQGTGVSSQGFKPNQSSTQSFAGKGEVFGGPRKPPSFDEQTGYHY